MRAQGGTRRRREATFQNKRDSERKGSTCYALAISLSHAFDP